MVRNGASLASRSAHTSRRMRCTFIFTFAFLLVHASAVQLALAEGESVGCVNAVCNSRVGFDAVSQLHISRTLWTPILCYLAS